MKRIESGDKRTKWKPRNKQAGLFLRKAREEFEPLPEITPRIVKPDPVECSERGDVAMRKNKPVGAPPRKRARSGKPPKFKGNKKPPRT